MPVSKSELNVGDSFYFKIRKIISFSPGLNYFVLEDPFRKYHLLPSQYYLEYSFELGNEVFCYVDKINCTGRIFIEPEHPIYKRGAYFSFIFSHTEIKKLSKRSAPILIFVVLDSIGNTFHSIPSKDSNRNFKASEIIICKVKSVKKGRVILIYED